MVRKTKEKRKRDQHGVHRGQQPLDCTEEVAAQNDYIYTRSFKVNCMGGAGDTHCRQCGEGIETIRHISANANQRDTTSAWNSTIVLC